MIRLLSDENFNNIIVRGVLRQLPDLDFVRIQDIGLRTQADPDILEFAGAEGRVVITHDVRTMEVFATRRIRKGLPMAGVFLIPGRVPIGDAIDSLVLVGECSGDGEWINRIQFLPFA